MSTRSNKHQYHRISTNKAKYHKWLILTLDVVIAVCFFGYIWLAINIVQMYLPKGGEYVYNCSVAEIHPNFTPAMRKTCRKQFEKETK